MSLSKEQRALVRAELDSAEPITVTDSDRPDFTTPCSSGEEILCNTKCGRYKAADGQNSPEKCTFGLMAHMSGDNEKQRRADNKATIALLISEQTAYQKRTAAEFNRVAPDGSTGYVNRELMRVSEFIVEISPYFDQLPAAAARALELIARIQDGAINMRHVNIKNIIDKLTLEPEQLRDLTMRPASRAEVLGLGKVGYQHIGQALAKGRLK